MSRITTAQTTPVADSRPEPPPVGERWIAIGQLWSTVAPDPFWFEYSALVRTTEADAKRDAQHMYNVHDARNVRVVRIPGDGK